MKRYLNSGKWIALAVVLSALCLSMVYADPVRAQQVGGNHTVPPRINVPNAVTGAAALVGIDEGGLLGYSDGAVTQAAGSGATLTRTEIDWNDIEAVRGTFDFTATDLVINRLTNTNLNNGGFAPVVYVSYNPSWTGSVLPCAPIDTTQQSIRDDFGTFMKTLAAHYPKVKVWALYNEPDAPNGDADSTSIGCMASSSSGGLNNNGVQDYLEYAIMLQIAWKAVHTANPNAKLAIGALALDSFTTSGQGVCQPTGYPGNCTQGGFRYEFTTNLFGLIGQTGNVIDGGKYADMVLFNYYELYGPIYWELHYPGHGIQAKANGIRSLMQAAGMPALDLLVSETGLSSLPPEDASGNKLGQARCVNILLVRGAAAKLQGVVWWTFKDYNDNDPVTYRQTWKYGIVDQDSNLKPSYYAMQTIVQELNGYIYSKTLSGKTGFTGIESYLFKSGKAQKYAVWSSTITAKPTIDDCSWTRAAKTATFKAKTIKIVNYMGVTKTIVDNKKGDKNKTVGLISFKVNGDPQFVTINPK